MSKLITASINLKKVNQDLLIPGEKGKYLNLTIWVNDEKDQYGNDVSVEQRTEKGADKIYLGNGRQWKQNEQSAADTNRMEDIDELFK